MRFRNPAAPHNQPPFEVRRLDASRSYVVGSSGVNVLGALDPPLPMFMGHERAAIAAEALHDVQPWPSDAAQERVHEFNLPLIKPMRDLIGKRHG